MIGIVVEDNVVVIPIPIVDIPDIIGRDAEVKAAEPEASGTTAFDPPDMAAANPLREMTMLPRVVKMIVSVVASTVVPDPLVVGMDVRSLRMALLVAERLVGLPLTVLRLTILRLTILRLTVLRLTVLRLRRRRGMVFGFWRTPHRALYRSWPAAWYIAAPHAGVARRRCGRPPSASSIFVLGNGRQR